MQENIVGIEQDTDAKFLHDYRVAVRRTRTALKDIPGIFSKKTVNRAAESFRILGKLSNKVRDLDVFLLLKAEYLKLISNDLQDGLYILFDYI